MLLKIINTRGLKKLQDIFRKDNLESTVNYKIYYKNIKNTDAITCWKLNKFDRNFQKIL